MSKPIRTKGLSLLEVVIASALMLMLLLAFYAVAETLSRSQITSDARLQARQQLRTGVRAFSISASEATCFYAGDGNPIVLGGYTCLLPESNLAGDAFVSGDTVVVAIPVDETRPTNAADDPTSSSTTLAGKGTPDGFHDNLYDIVALTSRPRQPADSRNPNSRQLILMRWTKVAPTTFGAPLTINLGNLGTPSLERVFDCYLKPLAEDGFRVNYRAKGTVAAAASIHTEYDYKPTKGPNQAESYEYLFNTRNIF